MTNEIQWEDGAVCYAYGKQQYPCVNLENFLNAPDFQLNEILTGDFIAASELDAEQKYNDVVEVFGWFGFPEYLANAGFNSLRKFMGLGVVDGEIMNSDSRERQLTYQQIMAIGKLKRMSDEKKTSNAVSTVNRDIERVSKNKYERVISDRQNNSAIVDVYDVLKAFNVTCPATQHAVKKLLCSGLRGHKDLETDLLEAKESITRAIELI